MNPDQHPSDFAGLHQEKGAGPPQPSHNDIMRELRYLRQDTHAWRNDSKQWRAEQAVINTEVRAELKRNTEITESIGAAMQAGKAATAIIKWCGYIAAAGVAIWTAIVSMRSGGSIHP